MEFILGLFVGGILFGESSTPKTKCIHKISLNKECKKCTILYDTPRTSVSTSPSASTSTSVSTSSRSYL